MHNYYIINDIVEFHPATSTLRDLHNPDHVVIFNSPAGRCLLLLIERAGTIVTKAEFFDTVWTNLGMRVSSNTFYQNISILRKGLKQIGLSEDLVVTIPRIGLTLSSSANIKKLTTSLQIEISNENVHSIDEQLSAIETEADRKYSVSGTNDNESSKSKGIITKKVKFLIQNPWAKFISTVLIVFTIVLLPKLKWNGSEKYFSNYIFFEEIKGCQVFISDETISDRDYKKFLARGEMFSESCKDYPWVYISFIPLLPRTSVIRCDNPMDKSNTCISDYFFEDK